MLIQRKLEEQVGENKHTEYKAGNDLDRNTRGSLLSSDLGCKLCVGSRVVIRTDSATLPQAGNRRTLRLVELRTETLDFQKSNVELFLVACCGFEGPLEGNVGGGTNVLCVVGRERRDFAGVGVGWVGGSSGVVVLLIQCAEDTCTCASTAKSASTGSKTSVDIVVVDTRSRRSSGEVLVAINVATVLASGRCFSGRVNALEVSMCS